MARSLVEGRGSKLVEKDTKRHASRRIAPDTRSINGSSAIETAAATAPLRAVCRRTILRSSSHPPVEPQTRSGGHRRQHQNRSFP